MDASYGLPMASNLRASALETVARGQPLVIMVTLEGCAFCKLVRQHYLPHWLSQGLSIQSLDMASRQVLRDERGQATTPKDWVASKGIRIAPTLVWLGARGEELVERLSGMSSQDFYGYYLDERMGAAIQRVQAFKANGS